MPRYEVKKRQRSLKPVILEVACLVLYMCIYGFGSPIPWLIASELFEQKYRSTAVSIGTFCSFGCAFLVSFHVF